MPARMDTLKIGDGLEITRLVTSDPTIDIPREIDSIKVTSLGPMFLKDSHGNAVRSLIIPSSVTKASPDALECSRVGSIEYEGDFKTFNSFGWTATNSCKVVCGDGFSFDFISGVPMCFPQFDEYVLESYHRIPEKVVLNRLGRPVMMTDDIRERYLRYLRSRIIPMAEHAIVEDDIGTLTDVIGSGAITEEDLYRMLEKSVRSGRISSTSIIMSALNRTGTE